MQEPSPRSPSSKDGDSLAQQSTEITFPTQPSTAESDDRGGFLMETGESVDWTQPMVSIDEGIESEDDPGGESARNKNLVREAAHRAEQQAQARETMLELANALNEMRDARRDLAAQLQAERTKCLRLQRDKDRMQDEIDQAKEAEERFAAEQLRKTMLSRGNPFMLSMMLEKSRDGYESNMFNAKANAARPGSGSASQSTAQLRRQTEPAASMKPSASSSGALHDSGDVPGVLSNVPSVDGCEKSETSEEDDPDPRGTGSRPCPTSLADVVLGQMEPSKPIVESLTTGDRVFFGWVLKKWNMEVEESRRRKAEEAEAARKRAVEEERKRKEAERLSKATAPLNQRIEFLDSQLTLFKSKLAEQEARAKEAETALESMRADWSERERRFLSTEDRLNAELAAARKALNDSEERNSKYLRELKEAQDRAGGKDKAHAEEVQRLKDSIRRLTGELDQAVILARHMRETALKAKRDKAHSVSPEKFSQLVGYLEEIKDQMAHMGRELDVTRDESASLRQKLAKNQRRLELERQFLPLLHKTSGPLGSKYNWQNGASAKVSEGPDKQVLLTAPQMRESQSTGALPPAGSRAGGPLGGGPLGGPLGGGV